MKIKTRRKTKQKPETTIKTVPGRTHRNPSKMTHVWLLHFHISQGFSFGSSQTTRKVVFSGGTPEEHPENPYVIKNRKTLDAAFSNILCFLVGMRGLETPIFIVFREVATRGFNYSPLNCRRRGWIYHPPAHIYIYIYTYIHIHTYIYAYT